MNKTIFSLLAFLCISLSWNCTNSNSGTTAAKATKARNQSTSQVEKSNQEIKLVVEHVRAANIQKEAEKAESKIPFEGYPDICAAALREDDYWIHIDMDGNQIGPAYWSMAYNFSCGMACVSRKGMRMGYSNIGGWYYFLNQQGEASKYGSDEPMQFYEDLAVVNYN